MKKLVIDTETTGFSPRQNKVLTVGMMLIDVEHDFLKILDTNHIFVKQPRHPVNPMALKVNRIDLKEHEKIADLPKVACKKINNFIDENQLHKTPLLGHNLSFDKNFLNAMFDEHKESHKFHSEYTDTMYLWNSLKRSGTVPFTLRSNLSTIADFFNVDTTNEHDALADCHITASVYQKMLEILRYG